MQERRTGAKKGGKASKGSAGGSSKPVIVITELPYQTNKAGFVADVAELVEKGTLTGEPAWLHAKSLHERLGPALRHSSSFTGWLRPSTCFSYQ